MRFASYPVSEAEGLVLAHTLELAARTLKKGRRLSAGDVATILEQGVSHVIGARLEPGDIDEDRAAARVAKAIAGGGTRVAEPATGRANLYATASGILVVDTERLLAINRLDEGLTIATLAPFDRVAAGEMLATIKIIPFAVPERVVSDAEKRAIDKPVIEVAGFKPREAGLVLTQLPQTKASVLKKRERVTAERLQSAGSTLTATEIVPHDAARVSAAILRMHAARLDPVFAGAERAIGGDAARTLKALSAKYGPKAAAAALEKAAAEVAAGSKPLLESVAGAVQAGSAKVAEAVAAH